MPIKPLAVAPRSVTAGATCKTNLHMPRILLALLLLLPPLAGWAGNPERTGQAGATQLLINPYARSSSINGAHAAYVGGIDAIMTNVAGLARMKSTELAFSHTIWLQGSSIRINNLGFGQAIGNAGTIGLSVMAFDFGEIERTTIDNPDGGIGTFSPTFLNLGLSFSREMVEDNIWIGATAKLVHESVPDAAANGLSFDAGVQFQDNSDRIHIGVSLRNIGPQMRYAGDGLIQRTQLGGNRSDFDNQVSIQAQQFELPTILQLALSYDFFLAVGTADSTAERGSLRITPSFMFESQAYGRDQSIFGLEVAYKDLFAIRASQYYEENIFDEEDAEDAFTGLALGASVFIPVGGNTAFGFDYSYRHTRWFTGTHVFGIRMTL